MGEIDPSQPLPIFAQLKTLLLEEIWAGKYRPGDQLPTEHELCARYKISRTPVHRALAELAEEGVVLRQRRRGSFVNPHWVRQPGNRRELRVVVPEGPWQELVNGACPDDVTLNVATVAQDDLHQVLTHAVAEGRAPDLALLDSVWVPEFAGTGFLYPLDELDPAWLDREYLIDVLTPFVSANRYDGRVVAVQAEADVAGLWYHRETLAARGLQVPTTWPELLEVGRRLRDTGHRHPLVMPGGSRGGEATTYCLLALMAANGATVVDDNRVTVGSQSTIECLTFLRELAEEGVLAVDAVAYEHDRAPRLLASGQAVMGIGGSYEVRTLAGATGMPLEQVSTRFGFVAPPRGPRGGVGTLGGGMVHAIFRQAHNPHLAMDLLKRLTSPSALAVMSQRTGQLASRRSAVALAAPGWDFLQSTAALLEQATLRPATRTYPRVSSQLQWMIEAVLLGRLEPAEAAVRAADMVAAITGLPVAADA